MVCMLCIYTFYVCVVHVCVCVCMYACVCVFAEKGCMPVFCVVEKDSYVYVFSMCVYIIFLSLTMKYLTLSILFQFTKGKVYR